MSTQSPKQSLELLGAKIQAIAVRLDALKERTGAAHPDVLALEQELSAAQDRYLEVEARLKG